MVMVLSLWVPILLSTLLVFLASFALHALLRLHAGDFGRLPAEDEIMAAFRSAGVRPGDYIMPHAATPAEMKAPEYLEKMDLGPGALVTVLPPGPVSIGRRLGLWFAYCLFVSVLAAYLASRGVPPGGDFWDVFRFAATGAFLGYAVGLWQDSIWYGRAWSTTIRNTLDGVLYAAITGAMLGWLWPG